MKKSELDKHHKARENSNYGNVKTCSDCDNHSSRFDQGFCKLHDIFVGMKTKCDKFYKKL